VKRAVAWGLKHRPWKPLHVIGIDEVSRAKGQRYLTLVYDLARRRLVWVGENRDAATMTQFFQWLGPRRARSIQVVCCDMWAIYLDAVRDHLPQARVLFDRFHVVQHLNRAVDEVRRDTWRKLSGLAKVAFKRTRGLWLKNPWNLKPPSSDGCRSSAARPISRSCEGAISKKPFKDSGSTTARGGLGAT
jgi:transposase